MNPQILEFLQGRKIFLFNIFLIFFFSSIQSWVRCPRQAFSLSGLYLCKCIQLWVNKTVTSQYSKTIGPIRSQNLKFMKCVCVCVITDIITEITILSLV